MTAKTISRETISSMHKLSNYVRNCPYINGETYEIFLPRLDFHDPADPIFMIFDGIDKFGRMGWKINEDSAKVHYMKPYMDPFSLW